MGFMIAQPATLILSFLKEPCCFWVRGEGRMDDLGESKATPGMILEKISRGFQERHFQYLKQQNL